MSNSKPDSTPGQGKKKARPHLFIANAPYRLTICAELAQEIGLNESIMLLQIEYLIRISNSEEHDGVQWTYQSAEDLHKEWFKFWSRATIRRTLKNLVDSGYLKRGNFNSKKYDRTGWYSLNYEVLRKLNSISCTIVQNEPRQAQNEPRQAQDETPIPNTPTDIPTDTPLKASSLDAQDRALKDLKTHKQNKTPMPKAENRYLLDPPYCLTASQVCALERAAAKSTESLERTAAWWKECYHDAGKAGNAFALILSALIGEWELYGFSEWGKTHAYA